MSLTSDELADLNALEDQELRGGSVNWDEPKRVGGGVARDVETFSYTDKTTGEERTKQVLTLRTADGLVAIFEGPQSLNAKLFDGERYDQPPLGPPATGDLLIVEYLGERTSQSSGRLYKAFRVFHRAAGARQPDPGDDIPF